jgi:pyruvate kinase
MLARQMRLIWGVHPFVINFVNDPEANITAALGMLRDAGFVSRGENLVLATNVLLGAKIIDSVQIRAVQ